MRITVLGSSHGVPEPNRKCACFMIEVAGLCYLIDMGVMAINELQTRGISVDAVKGVFITHMHGDHTDGLPHFVDLLSWYFRTADPVICLPQIESVDALHAWIRANEVKPRALQYREVLPGMIYEDAVLSVTAIPTQHCDRSYAYLVRAEGKNLLFTGDLRHPAVDFPAVDAALDLLVCESAHFSPLEYLPILQERKIKKIVITHYSPKRHADALQFIREANDIPVTLVTDGLEIQL